MQIEHKRNLPHIYKTGVKYFKKEYNLHKRYFAKYDLALHQNKKNLHLENNEIAELVAEAMKFYHKEDYYLISYCIMPNHVHFVFYYKNSTKRTISQIMQSIKGYTGYKANQIIGKTGKFWQHKSFDHIIRNNKELDNIISYVKLNPVEARLVDNWEKWKYTYNNLV